jgi:O-succinylbenzoic acid--CoA ligase
MTPAILPDWLDTAAEARPDTPGLSFGDTCWTFAELRQAVAVAASELRPHWAARGSIGILATNRPGFVFAVHAAQRLGASFVPLNWRLTPAEIAWQLRDANVSLLLTDDHVLADAAIAAAGLSIGTVPIEQIEEDGTARTAVRARHAVPLRRGDATGADGRCGIDLSREAGVIYTSGTTGRPKGVRLTYGNLWHSAVGSALHLGHHRRDVWLAAMPLFHVGGLSILYRSVIGATPLVLHDRFEVERVLAAIDGGATLVSVVPTTLRRLLDARGDALWPPTLRCVLVGGAPAPGGLIEECLDRGVPIAPTYGLTESASQVTTLLPEMVEAKLGSSGLPLPVTRLRVSTPNGPARPGELGQIEIQGPTLFAGYVHDEEALSRRAPDGWFGTGDLGALDEEGYLTVADRRDDLIVSGGENISPAEVERVLLTHSDVIDAGVVGMPDDVWGQRPVAAVVWRGDRAAAETALAAHCELRLARFKTPNVILVYDALPRSASGKLLRHVLLDRIREQVEGV